MSQSRETIFNLLLNEKKSHPLAQPQDFYKLLYQAAFGMEHIIPTVSLFENALLLEIQSVEPDASKPLLQNISIRHPISRINLASAKYLGLSVSSITRWSLESCRHFQQIGRPMFRDMIQEMSDILITSSFGFTSDELTDFSHVINQADYPPLHHSDIYRQTYSPHYRLLDPAIIDIGVIND